MSTSTSTQLQLLTLPGNISLPRATYLQCPDWQPPGSKPYRTLNWKDLIKPWAIRSLERGKGSSYRVGFARGWGLSELGCLPGQMRLLDAKDCVRAMVYAEDQGKKDPAFMVLRPRYGIERGYIEGEDECQWFYAAVDHGTYLEKVLRYHGLGSLRTRTPEAFPYHPEAPSWEEYHDKWARDWLSGKIPWWAEALEWDREV